MQLVFVIILQFLANVFYKNRVEILKGYNFKDREDRNGIKNVSNCSV